VAFLVIFTDAADRALRRLPAPVQKRARRQIDLLAEDPRHVGTRQLVGYPHIRRVHAGKDYVILYTIDHGKVTVIILRIEHRRDVYRSL
jgi:mRNA interferase RelE/StbE